DGNLWIADYFDQTIGKLTTAGVFTRFSAGGYPFGIASGPDGNLWFTERYGGNIGRVTTAGAITEFPVPSSGELFGITAGPDGNLWFTESGANKIVKLNVNSPHYNVCLLYDPTKAVKSGSTIPIKLQLCDATGNDLSSSGITLHAVSVTQVSSSISGDVQ